MKSVENMDFHVISENIVKILCEKTQNTNPMFFRILVSYHLAKMAAMMRVKVFSKAIGKIPVNIYAVNLAESGHGKGNSMNMIEDNIMHEFRSVFYDQTYPLIVEESLAQLATKRAAINETDPDLEIVAVQKEFKDLGAFLSAFDSGTAPAVKQAHHKLLMAKIGSMNMEIDEIGNNLTGNLDVLTTFLELFDVGKIKQKLIKNSKDNNRSEEIEGRVPANLLMFGAPSKLLNGTKTEDEFFSLMDVGMARRCLFGYTRSANKDTTLTPSQIYDILTDNTKNQYLVDLATKFAQLANIINHNKLITVSREISELLIEYRLTCERNAENMGDNDIMAKAEMSHRYFKALKLAGTYAFIDGDSEVTESNLYAAIRLVEESGKAFGKILTRDQNYAKLARYIASVSGELTHVDLMEKLTFYKGTAAFKNELMLAAVAWGYKNRIIIKKSISNGIEFLQGEMLEETNLEKLRLSYSTDIALGYKNVIAPYNKLHQLVQKDNLHWINHHLDDGHRCDASIIPGITMVVLDVEDSVPMPLAMELLKDYACLFHTTKRHTAQDNRYRIIMPTNYFIELDETEFKEFMMNIYEWLPFEVDTAAKDRPRKWATCKGQYVYSPGEKLLDVLEFIPKTSKNDARKQIVQDLASLSNIERWFAMNTTDGNRSNQLIKYALLQVDMGADFNTIRNSVLDLNDKLQDKMDVSEIDATIMVTTSKAISARTP